MIQDPIAIERVLSDIVAERYQQELKWSGRSVATDPDHTLDRCLVILVEEVGEVAKALNDHEPAAAIRAELIQVAARLDAAVLGVGQ